MIRKAYKVVTDADNVKTIRRVDITDTDGVSWREAKKQLRAYFIKQAHVVRAMRESDIV